MNETFWSNLDDYLVVLLEQEMGQASEYTDLVVQKVQAGIVKDLSEWADWPLPFVLVLGHNVVRKPGPHDGNGLHFDKTLPYTIMTVNKGDRTTSWQNAKILEKRVELTLRFASFRDLIIGSDGEALKRVSVNRGSIDQAPRLVSEEDNFFGFSFTEIDFYSSV